MADSAEIRSKLNKLTIRQCQILYWVCRGLTYPEIGQTIGYGEDLVQAEMTAIYKLFNLTGLKKKEKRRIFKDEIYPIHLEMVSDPQKDCTNRIIEANPPPTDLVVLEEVKRDEEEGVFPLDGALTTWESKPSGMVRTKYPEPIVIRETPWRLWLLIGCLGFLFIATLIVLIEVVVVFQLPSNPFRPVLPTEVGSLQTITPRVVVATATMPAPTSIPSAIPTSTSIVAVVPTIKSEPTLAPTPRPSPTPSLKLPFTDSFNRSIRPEWQVSVGRPVIVNNELRGTGDGVTLRLEHNYNPYVVDFDFASSGVQYGRITITLADMMKYNWNRWDSGWQALERDQWVNISGGAPISLTGHFRLVVDGSTYNISFNGKPIPSVSYGTPITGPFEIFIANDTGIKNFSMAPR